MRTRILITLLILLSFVSAGYCVEPLLECVPIDKQWQVRQVGTEQWMPATVPGCNHTDLLANKKIKDPFWRTNEADLQWIDKKDWEYKTEFDVSKDLLKKDRVALHFEGLDTFADVTVNGKKVLSADNMFREWWVDLKKELKPGKNQMHILFRSPITEGIRKHDSIGYKLHVLPNDQAEHGKVPDGKQVSVFVRKAGYHFGWDWGPRLVSSGVWRPVTLKAWDTAKINDLRIVQNNMSDKSAELTAFFEIEAEQAEKVELEVVVDGKVLVADSVKLKKGTHTYNVDFEIKDPELWWCNGLGEAHLYSVMGKLKAGKQETSETHRIGVRTVELVREKDDMGTPFYFKVNGVPVFIKGANYIPNDIFPTRVTDEKYRQVIKTAKDSNFNMLRVWGGGLYENDIFYDLCDENGILVWQDFMFACNMFPGNKEFLENVRQEAVDNVRRLRNHPSIAMWCGNNEILVIQWQSKGTLKKWKRKEYSEYEDILWKAYADLFHDVLPSVVTAHDPGRFYWASSPSAGPGLVSREVGLEHGDEHYWGVWHRKEPYETYSTYIARFMSEYGFQSFPEIRTIKEFAIPEDYGLLTEVMTHHQRSPIGNQAIAHYMLQSYFKPKKFESLLYVGQVLQAELIKYAVESHRRAMPFCMGTLYWQLNDCWPVASWSSMDSSLRWKAQQYFMRKAFDPVLISPFEKEGTLNVHLISDKLDSVNCKLSMRLIDFNGGLKWKKTTPVELEANTSRIAFDIKREELLQGNDDKTVALIIELKQGDTLLADAVYYFNKVKHLELPKPKVTVEMKPVAGGFDIVLETDVLAKNLYMTIGDNEGSFEDNYFDLMPGQKKTIKLVTGISHEKLKEDFKTISISEVDYDHSYVAPEVPKRGNKKKVKRKK